MIDVEVIEDAAAAASALDPIRSRLLAALHEPRSATSLANELGLPRQKVNYHLRALETHGLVTLADVRRHGGLTERLLQATAASYVVAPTAMAGAGADPSRTADRLSSGHLVAVASRIVTEVGRLQHQADDADARLPTLTIDTEIGFASAEDRAAFADELTAAVVELAARYHHDDGRLHRLVVAAHPWPNQEDTE